MVKHIRGHVSHILLNTALITLPMLALSGFLLGLVYGRRIHHSPDDMRAANVTDDSGVLYVDMDSTQLATVASWSSTVAPGLAGMIIALFSYQTSKQLLKGDRVTPYQFGLIMGIINSGAFTAAWEWLRYILGWRTRRPQSRALQSASLILATALVMSLLVLGTDTWLHVSITTVPFVRLTPTSSMLSYALSDYCLHSRQNEIGSSTTCSANAGGDSSHLANGTEGVRLLAGVSDTTAVSNWSNTAFLVPQAQRTVGIDFTASTYGARTQCKLISRQCNLQVAGGPGCSYNCSNLLRGYLSSNTGVFNFTFWKDSTWNSVDESFLNSTNPFTFAWPGVTNLNGGSRMLNNDSSPTGTISPDIIVPMHGGLAFILGCVTTVLDVTYSMSQGNITYFSASPSNNSVTDMLRQPMLQTASSWAYLQQQQTLAAFSTSGQELADKLAFAWSSAVLSLAVGSLSNAPAQQAQQRSTINVARVPVRPLFALIAANMLFVIVGLIVMVLAFVVSSETVVDVQARLSWAGLMAERFEECRSASSIEDLFEEHEGRTSSYVRIVEGSQGGYALTTRQYVSAVEEYPSESDDRFFGQVIVMHPK